MSIVNRRNAVFGWSVWQVAKRVLKRKAKSAVPGTVDDSLRPNKPAIVSAVAAAFGALWFWRRRKSDGDVAV
jgi:hypothetical protein